MQLLAVLLALTRSPQESSKLLVLDLLVERCLTRIAATNDAEGGRAVIDPPNVTDRYRCTAAAWGNARLDQLGRAISLLADSSGSPDPAFKADSAAQWKSTLPIKPFLRSL